MSNSSKNKPTIIAGNAKLDSLETRGWLIGNFIAEKYSLRHTDDVELKWGEHDTGDSRSEWVTGEIRTTIGILISGEFTMEFPGRTVVLSKPGDYVMWGAGVAHKWHVNRGGIFLTIRWPSVKSAQE